MIKTPRIISNFPIDSDIVLSVFFRFYFVAISFLITVSLTRLMSIDLFGEYIYYYTFSLFLVGLSSSGIRHFIVREAASNKNQHAIKSILLFSFGSSILIFILIFLISFIFLKTITNYHFFYLITILSFSQILIIHLSSVIRGMGYISLGQFADLFIKPSIFLVAVLSYYLIQGEIRSDEALYIQVFAVLISLAYISVNFKMKYFLLPLQSTEIRKKQSIWSFYQVATIGWLVVANTHLIILFTAYFSDTTQIAILRIATQCAMVIGLGITAIETVQAPKFSIAAKEKDVVLMKKLLNISCVLSTMFSLLPGILLLISADYLITLLFGQKFVDAALPLKILVAGQVINSLTGNVGILLISTHHEKSVAAGMFLALIVMLSTSLVFIPLYGAVGAAIAITAAVVSRTIFLLGICWHRLEMIALPIPIPNRSY